MTKIFYLAKFEKNWADEFQVYGLKVITEETKLKWDAIVAKYPDRMIEFSFGTNEGWEDVELAAFYRKYKFIQIDTETYDTLKFLLGGIEWGHFPDIEEITMDYDDEEED